MASVKSLGLHEPSGLRHAVQEQILPPNPKPDGYRWETSVDHRDDDEIEDELLITDTCVIWSRGQLFRKAFRLDQEKETITHALLTYFPTSEHSHVPEDASTTKPAAGAHEKRALSKALVVFLKTQAHIYFLSGTSHVVHMPFEVESACAAPQGVIIQRRQRGDHFSAPDSLAFPRAPPNSFVSSQVTNFSSSHQQHRPPSSTFSIEGLGKPKALPLRLRSSLGNMWDSPVEQPDSRWPRLVCLTDPLLELGLVVTAPEAGRRSKAKRGTLSHLPAFLDPSEEILHVEKVYDAGSDSGSLTLAVTINRDADTYTIWRLEYLTKEDPFIGRAKKTRSKSFRRRSSMQPPFTSGANTPVQPNFRESFGAPLPGKRTRARKSENVEKAKDLVASSLELDAEAGAARRQSRRISSMLARADLSSSQYAEQPLVGVHNTSKRADSHGSHYGRHSGGYASFNHSQTIHPSLNSLLEAPVGSVLDELRSGGDFEGFNSMGLDDHDFSGLAQEISFTKVKSLPIDTSSIRFSLSSQPTREQCRVFILTAPPSTVDAQQRTQLVVGIQDTAEKKLHLITIYFKRKEKRDILSKTSRRPALLYGGAVIPTVGELRHAKGVVDSCKIEEKGLSMIFILSEKLGGGHELSIQAPWEPLTTITLPLLYLDNVRSLQFNGRAVDRDLRQKRSETISCENGSITRLAHPKSRGTVDLVDRDGRFHQIRIQLQPSSPMVCRVLDVCRNVLPFPHGESMLGGWWHVMQWAQREDLKVADIEWSCLVVLMLSLYLALDPENMREKPGRPVSAPKKRHTRSSSFSAPQASDDWGTLRLHEAKNSLACPEWMLSPAWEWALDQMANDPAGQEEDSLQFRTGFMGTHIRHARQFMASAFGEVALGDGDSAYLPTAVKCPPELRRQAAGDLAFALNLLLEEQKLDIMTPDNGPYGSVHLRVLLCQITRWLEWSDLHDYLSLGIQEELDPGLDSELSLAEPIPEQFGVTCVLEWAQSHLATPKGTRFPTLADIYFNAMRISERDRRNADRFIALTPRTLMLMRLFTLLKPKRSPADTVEAIHKAGITLKVMESLPEALLVPIRDAIARCQPHPPSTWSSELFELVNRSDMNLILTCAKPVRSHTAQLLAPTHAASWDVQMLCQSVDEYNSTGIDEGEASDLQAIIRALFKEDRRLNEAQDILSTHKARVIRLDPQPGWTESEYLEHQKEVVSSVATGTLAIPAGRGLLYYSLRFPLLTQKFHIGGFNLNCVVKPSNVTVGVDKTLFTEEKVCWGFFHQGVSAGLSISPHAKGIDTSWILYNKPGQELSNRHAGFLLALGLNGHLKGVAKWVAFKYLTPRHTMTSIGLLLGLAASYMGTMDSLITRLLSVHVTRMLPRGAAELNLSPLTQTSGIMGIGLLYCNSQHRRMSEVMMSEIQHIDEEDEEEPLRSEGYRLAAGFALGYINLGRGSELRGPHDTRLTEQLVAIATATKKVEVTHILDRAAAGAVMAIALMYMKSGDAVMARKIDVPDSIVQFDYIRPDVLMLRALAKNLILWSDIRPTREWILESLPGPYRAAFPLSSYTRLTSKSLPFFAILAGTAFALGLRFAGSANVQARDVLVSLLDDLMRIARLAARDPPVYDEELARSYARTAQDVVAVSGALVMAGTGDLVLLRRLRSLHGHAEGGPGAATSTTTPYGSHLAAHLAVGALFLSCGTATFSTRDEAIASLLVGFYPVWPGGVGDNKAHLQAFRHFWVLAVDERCLVTRDMATSQPVSVAVRIEMKAGAGACAGGGGEDGGVWIRNTPCLLPPLEDIKRVVTDAGPTYWDVELDFAERNAARGGSSRVRDAARRRTGMVLGTGTGMGMGPGAKAGPAAKMRVVYLQRRPPLSSPFSTMADTTPSPLRWLFTLGPLRFLSPADRAAVLDTEAGAAVSAVDVLLELRRAVGSGGGGDRSALVGVRLLLEWVRGREGGAGARDWWVRRDAVEGLRGDIFLKGS